MESKLHSFAEVQELYVAIRKPFIEEFQKQLLEMAGVEFSSRNDRKIIVKAVNKTRSMLAVTFHYGDNDIKVNLAVASTSFQLKTTGVKRRHAYAGTSFPQLKVVDPFGE